MNLRDALLQQSPSLALQRAAADEIARLDARLNSALESLMNLAVYLGIDPDEEERRPGYNPRGPASATLIAAIERRIAAA